MASEMSAGHAPAGDVTAAILEVDSTLKRINGTGPSHGRHDDRRSNGLSPGLWRAAYGPWRREELMALERTLLILAQEINAAYGTDDAALRMVMDVLAAADDDSTL